MLRYVPGFTRVESSGGEVNQNIAMRGILGVAPEAMMCASSRMVVKPKGAERPHVVACTLLPHDARFAMGETLEGALRPIALNHPHCARFCVLGGASCSG